MNYWLKTYWLEIVMTESAFVPIYIGRTEIPIACAIIDAEDLRLADQYKWTFSNFGYPMAKSSGKMIRLHRFVTQAPDGLVVDHINGNPLDNRKANLRVCTQKENSRNRKAYSTNKSGFKGVSYDKRLSAYRATITIHGKQKYLGRYKCPIAAAMAYNEAAQKYHCEHALLNEIKPEQCLTQEQILERRVKARPATIEPGISAIRYSVQGEEKTKYQVRYSQTYLGLFNTVEQAREARQKHICWIKQEGTQESQF